MCNGFNSKPRPACQSSFKSGTMCQVFRDSAVGSMSPLTVPAREALASPPPGILWPIHRSRTRENIILSRNPDELILGAGWHFKIYLPEECSVKACAQTVWSPPRRYAETPPQRGGACCLRGPAPRVAALPPPGWLGPCCPLAAELRSGGRPGRTSFCLRTLPKKPTGRGSAMDKTKTLHRADL